MERKCECCGAEITTGPYWKRFCAKKCRLTAMGSEYREGQRRWYEKNRERAIRHVCNYRKENKEKVRKWNLDYLYRTVYEGMRTALLEKHGNKCFRCGEEKEARKDIHVHHLDFNRDNNLEENLQLLCSRCHRSIHMAHKMKIYWEKKRSSTG